MKTQKQTKALVETKIKNDNTKFAQVNISANENPANRTLKVVLLSAVFIGVGVLIIKMVNIMSKDIRDIYPSS